MNDTLMPTMDQTMVIALTATIVDLRRELAEALSRQPSDMVLVPREPTEAMVKAFEAEGGKFSYLAWSAMLAAVEGK